MAGFMALDEVKIAIFEFVNVIVFIYYLIFSNDLLFHRYIMYSALNILYKFV